MEVKKSFYAKYIGPKIGPSILITLLVGGTTIYLDSQTTKIQRDAKDAEIETRIYESPKQLQKAIAHDNEVPSDVDTYIREQQNIAIGDKLIVQQEKLDSQQKELQVNIKVIDSFYQFSKKKEESDSIKEIKKQKSRDERSNEIQNIGNTVRALQKLLDTTN